MTQKEVDTLLRQMYSRDWDGKPGTGRKRTKTEMEKSLKRYRDWLEEKVTVNMPWKDYFEFSDIATYIRPENAIDMAFRLGYLYGNGSLTLPEDEAREGKQKELTVTQNRTKGCLLIADALVLFNPLLFW